MFYSVQILNKKEPLGIIWIAAHLDRRLKKSQVNDTSIPSSVGALTAWSLGSTLTELVLTSFKLFYLMRLLAACVQ